jgi:hypothetical protein
MKIAVLATGMVGRALAGRLPEVEGVPDGDRAMADRESIKVMVTP